MIEKRGVIEFEVDDVLFRRLERVAAAKNSPDAVMAAGGISRADLRRAIPELPLKAQVAVKRFLAIAASRQKGVVAVAGSGRRVVSGSMDLIVSKTRTKAAVKKCNVGSEFYRALDEKVREIIKEAERRATNNKRKTLKAIDL